MTGKESV